MKELDLHGLYHYQIWSEVENFVLLNSKHIPLRIITGYSEFMKKTVGDVLAKYNFEYYTPAHNPGEIIVTFDKDYTV